MSSSSQVLESTREIIQKLRSTGQTHELISAVTGLALDVVRQVLVEVDDPQRMQAKLAQAHQMSFRYRCSHSARLMRSPVQASNRRLYEKEVLEALLKSGQNELISEGSTFTELNYLKENIRHFSKDTLKLMKCALSYLKSLWVLCQTACQCSVLRVTCSPS
jgi:hypothetical protein